MPPVPTSGGLLHLEGLARLEDRHRSLSFEAARAAVLDDVENSWRFFVEKYSRFVYSIALRLLPGSLEGREDLAQDTYLSVFSRLQGDNYRLLRDFRGRCRFTTYLFRMVQTSRSEALRRAGREGERTEYIDFSDEANRAIQAAVQDGKVDAFDIPSVSPQRLRDHITRAVEGLSPREKLLLRLRFQEGLKLRELAAALGYRDTNDAAYGLRKSLKSMDLSEILEAGQWTEEDRRGALEILNDVLFQ